MVVTESKVEKHKGGNTKPMGDCLKGKNDGMRLGGERGVFTGESSTKGVGGCLKGSSHAGELGKKAGK